MSVQAGAPHNECTFAGWTRTSLACVAIGVGFHAPFPTNAASVASTRYRDSIPAIGDCVILLGAAALTWQFGLCDSVRQDSSRVL